MNEPYENDLQYRIFRLLDGEADETEVVQLDAELRKDPEARKLYQKYVQLHNALESRCISRTQIGHSPAFSIDKLLIRERRRMVKRSLLAAAAVISIGFIALWMMMVESQPRTLVHFEVAPNSDYSLTHSGGNQDSDDNTLRTGSRLQLKTGVMEGKFDSGVRFVVEAPCVLRVVDKDHIAMDEGTGWFEVPPAAVGFTVETRQFTVVDLGTLFGIVAQSGKGHEIHVTKGRVEVISNATAGEKNKLVLNAGHARRMDEAGKLAEIPLDSSRFATELPQVPILRNYGFESLDVLHDDRDPVGYGRIPQWGTSGEGVGYSNIEQPFLEQPAHDGERVAFIQGTGAISQSASGFDPSKKYTVTYFVSERGLPDATSRTSVSLDLGSSFYTYPHPITKTDTFRRIVSGPLHVFGSTANIEIGGQTLTGDASLLIDSVSISRAVPIIPDGGFEYPVQPSGGFKQANGTGDGELSGTTWRILDGGGITTNRSAFSPPQIPEGSQSAILQNSESAIETTVNGFEPGVTYRLRLEAAGREGGANPVTVTLGGKSILFQGSETITPSIGNYQSFTCDEFQVTSDTLPLIFQGSGVGTTFLDDLRFEFVAEAENDR